MFFSKCVHQGRHAERKAVIGRDHKFVLTQPAKIPPISRSSLYYQPRLVSEPDLRRRHQINEFYLECPLWAHESRAISSNWMERKVGRKHVSARMKKMRIEALSRQPNTSQRHPRHMIYSYRLRSLIIDRPNAGLGHGYQLSPNGPGLGLLEGRAGLIPLRFSIPVWGVS